MKSIFSMLVALLLVGTGINAQAITDGEKSAIVAYYNEGSQNLLKELNGLSEAQLNWKPNDSTWNIANCVEHIAISEKSIFDWAMSTLKEPADPKRKSEVKLNSDQVKAMVESREKKVKTMEPLKPTGQFGNEGQTLDTFNKRRAANIKYINTTTDDLHSHFAKTPLGTLDTYQVLIFLNAHTKRHTAQIAELKTMAGFPK